MKNEQVSLFHACHWDNDKIKVIATRGLVMKKKLILANNRSRLVSLRNLRKG